jgi:hypothetical protein
VPELLAQIDMPFDTFIAYGAYDGDPVSKAMLDLQPDAQVVVRRPRPPLYQQQATASETTISESLNKYGRIA